ncbi:hypothetical protein FRC02_002288 [Tulasnella sp. 418]|nr:hypothetical protein FRC02_002288 [Tulasnella sp. 418]
MSQQYYSTGARSPPPLQHPIPTHAYSIPEPEPDSYTRYTSPPQPPQKPLHQSAGPQHMGYGVQPGYPAQPAYGVQYPAPQPGAQPAPSFNGWGVDDATAQMGLQLGRTAMAAGQDYVEKNFGRHFLPLALFKQQFNVSNSYVLQKLRILLFPWRHRPWARKVKRSDTSGQSEGYMAPRDDINSPDLYIPSMAFVTYVLSTAVAAGLRNQFRPEVLGVTASKSFAVLLMEFGIVKLGCYFLNIQGSSQVVDLLAYGGYKFVGSIINVLSGLLLGPKMWWAVFVYTFASNGFFLLRSLRYVILPEPTVNVGNSGVTPAQRGWRIKFLFALAMSQLLYMGILAWT